VLQRAGAGRIAADAVADAATVGDSFTIDLQLTDGAAHQVAFYVMDWSRSRHTVQRIDVIAAGTGAVLDSRTASQFGEGQYWVWRLAGHVQIRFTGVLNGPATVSGLFSASPEARAIQSDDAPLSRLTEASSRTSAMTQEFTFKPVVRRSKT
jgi:hypothetical protein